MDSINKQLANFGTILEIYGQQDLKFEEIQLQEEKLLDAEVEKKHQTLVLEVTKYNEALTEKKMKDFKAKKIDEGKCELTTYQTKELKSQQERKRKLEYKENELSKCKREDVKKFVKNLQKLRLQFNFENLSESITDAKKKLSELHQQAENDQQSNTVITRKYQQVPKRTIDFEVKITNQSWSTMKKSKEIKSNRKRLLSFLTSLKEEEKRANFSNIQKH